MKPSRTGIDRRSFLSSAAGFGLLTVAGCTTSGPDGQQQPAQTLRPLSNTAPYRAMPNEKFPIPAVKPGELPQRYQRRRVSYRTSEAPGTVIVDTSEFYLYHVEPGGSAMRYGVGLGRAGFAWSGRARIAWKRKWPTWTPPETMIRREPHLRRWSAENGGMPPGLDNPLGSRALYIFQGNRDTLYRLHGTPQVSSIGKAVSSGCVRLVNQDVIDLYDRVKSGSAIVVT